MAHLFEEDQYTVTHVSAVNLQLISLIQNDKLIPVVDRIIVVSAIDTKTSVNIKTAKDLRKADQETLRTLMGLIHLETILNVIDSLPAEPSQLSPSVDHRSSRK